MLAQTIAAVPNLPVGRRHAASPLLSVAAVAGCEALIERVDDLDRPPLWLNQPLKISVRALSQGDLLRARLNKGVK